MRFRKESLIHSQNCFERSTILDRKRKLGLTNEARIELFLWDLEIFCQIQKRLKNRIILKGGAAAQLYFPVDRQRTSVDIDMICSARESEIKDCLNDIEKAFKGEGNLLKFRTHKPRAAKTELPLRTFFMTIPSEVSTGTGEKGIQEIKVEFFLDNMEWPAKQFKSPQVFAMETDQSYRVLTLEAMIADKLTTLGSNTIGIPDSRRDELCKQIYDIDGLLHYPYGGKHNILEIKDLYKKRAKLECASRKVVFNLAQISEDVMSWLRILLSLDFEGDSLLWKDINDFQSLYLRRAINRGKWQWATIGEKLRFYLTNLYADKPLNDVWEKAIKLEDYFLFNELEGRARGEIIRKFKESF
ncbi:MAG: nucleotidyl transferase AbiEii/AbiGii toxin family protein [Candidatus Aminicenantaceae bacterium]